MIGFKDTASETKGQSIRPNKCKLILSELRVLVHTNKGADTAEG